MSTTEHENGELTVTIMPERVMVETIELVGNELIIALTGHPLLRTEDVPLIARPEVLRIRDQGPAPISALKFTTSLFGLDPECWADVDWRKVACYPVMKELRQRYIEVAKVGRLTGQVAAAYFGQVRMVCKEAWKLEWISRDVYERIHELSVPFAQNRRRRRIVSTEEFGRALQLCDVDGTKEYARLAHARYWGSRTRGIMTAAVLMALRCGFARSVEIRRLKFEDVDWGLSELYLTGKALKTRLVAVPPECMERLRAWREIRGDEPGPLFYKFKNHSLALAVDSKGQPIGMTQGCLQNTCKRIRGALKIPDFQSHTIGRRSGITFSKSPAGGHMSDSDIMAQSGHEGPAMLKLYDQEAIERWHGVWADPKIASAYLGDSGSVEGAPVRQCAICQRDLDHLEGEPPMRAGATVCRRPTCRKANQRGRKAPQHVS